MNWPALILAIAMVESGNDPNAVGKAGEVSRLQISDIMRRDYIRLYRPAYEPTMHDLRHSPGTDQYIFKYMVQHYGADKSVTSAALFWHHGPSWMRKNNKDLDYARRVNALYVEYCKDTNQTGEIK